MNEDLVRQNRVARAIEKFSPRAARAYEATIRKRAAMNREFAAIQAGDARPEISKSEDTP